MDLIHTYAHSSKMISVRKVGCSLACVSMRRLAKMRWMHKLIESRSVLTQIGKYM